MTAPEPPPLDELRIIEVLDRHGVDYVLVGGLGARLHGATRVTRDFDACPAWGRDNRERLAGALRELGARLRDFPPELRFPIDADSLDRMVISTWTTEAGDLDVLIGIPSATGEPDTQYEALRARASHLEIAGHTVYYASLDDIIVSKEVAGRPKDLEALPELQAIRDAQRPRADDPPGAGPPT